MRGQHAEFTGLCRHERVCEFIGSGWQVIGGPDDAIIADLRLIEEPPTPAAREGIFGIVNGLYSCPLLTELAGLEVLVQDVRPGRNVIFEHDIVGVVG